MAVSLDEHPKVGDDLIVEVVPSQTRTSYFPDQGAVFGRGSESVEIVFLRQEVRLLSQLGKVVRDHGNSMEIEFQPHQIKPELLDVAHVRMDMGPATETAFAILSIALQEGVLDVQSIMNRLQKSTVRSI